MSNLLTMVVTSGFRSRMRADQVTAAPRAHRFQLAGLEGVLDLLVQVGAVGDDDDPRVDDLPVEGECAAKHDHGEGLARALGVPDYAALASAVGANMLDALHGPLDREELLVAGDLADAGVEDREAADQVEEAVRTAEGVDGPVLGGDGAGAFGGEGSFPLGAPTPALPELLRGADGRVACLPAAEREQKLGEVEEVRDVLSALVADQLTPGLPDAPGGQLVLDDDEGDAVDEGDDIEAAGLEAARAFNLHGGGDVVDVVGGIVPVDVAKRVRLEVTGDLLCDGRAEDEEVVGRLVGAAESLRAIGGGAEAPDGFVGVFQVESIAAATVGEAVDREETVGEDVVEEDVAEAAAAVVEGVGLGEWGVAERDEALQRGEVGVVGLGGVGGHGIGMFPRDAIGAMAVKRSWQYGQQFLPGAHGPGVTGVKLKGEQQ